MIKEDDDRLGGSRIRAAHEDDDDRTDDEEGAVEPDHDRYLHERHSSSNYQPRSSPRSASLSDHQSGSAPAMRRWGYNSDRHPPAPSSATGPSRNTEHYASSSSQRYRSSPERERERDLRNAPPFTSRFAGSRAHDERPMRPPPRGGDSYRPGSASSSRSYPTRAPSLGPLHDDRGLRTRDREWEGAGRERNYSHGTSNSGNSRRSLSPMVAREDRDARWGDRWTGQDADVDLPGVPASGPNSFGPRPGIFTAHSYKEESERNDAGSWSTNSTPAGHRRSRWSNARDREPNAGGPDIWRPSSQGNDERAYSHRSMDYAESSEFPVRSFEDGPRRRGDSSQLQQRQLNSEMNNPPAAMHLTRSPPPDRRSAQGAAIHASEPPSPSPHFSDPIAQSGGRPPQRSFDPPTRDSGWAAKVKKDESDDGKTITNKAPDFISERGSDKQVPARKALDSVGEIDTALRAEQISLEDAPKDQQEVSSSATASTGHIEEPASFVPQPCLPTASAPAQMASSEVIETRPLPDNLTDKVNREAPKAAQTERITAAEAAPGEQELGDETRASIDRPLESEDRAAVREYADEEARQIVANGESIEELPQVQPLPIEPPSLKADIAKAHQASHTAHQDVTDASSQSGTTSATAPFPKTENSVSLPNESVPTPSASEAPTLPAEAQMQDALSTDGISRPQSQEMTSGTGAPTAFEPAATETRSELLEEGTAGIIKAEITSPLPPSERALIKPDGVAVEAALGKPENIGQDVMNVEQENPVVEQNIVTSVVYDGKTVSQLQDVEMVAREELDGRSHSEQEASPPVKSQAELDETKRAAIKRLLTVGKQPDDDETVEKLIAFNRRVAKQTTWSVLESKVHGPPFVVSEKPIADQEDEDTERVRPLLTKRIQDSNIRLHAKMQRLRQQYKALNADWQAHCARLDRAAEVREKARQSAAQTGTPNNGQDETTSAAPQPLLTPSAMSGRASTRRGQSGGGLGFGDAVRSEAEFLEILASLESADMQDPEARAARTATTVPDQLVNPDIDRPLMYDFEEGHGHVADPIAFYLDEFDPDYWSPEEKATFARKYALWPKQFGKIANALPHKTAAQCVYYYYLTKHQPGHDYKAITAARNRNSKRKTRIIKPKKGRGSALMADLKSAKGDELVVAAEDDEQPASPMEGRPRLTSTSGDAGLYPLTEEVEAGAESPSTGPSSAKKRKNQSTYDDPLPPESTQSKPKTGTGRGGKRVKGQGKGKTAGAASSNNSALPPLGGAPLSEDQSPSPSVDSPSLVGTPAGEIAAEGDLAAAEALGALSGVFSGVSSMPSGAGKASKKRKVSGTADGGSTPVSSEDGMPSVLTTGAQQRKVRQATSSYWSIQERADFLRGVAAHGKEWSAVAANLGAKSAAQARNYFARNAEVPEFIEAAAIAQQNAEQPLEMREQLALEWVKERLGLSAGIVGAAGEVLPTGAASVRTGETPAIQREASPDFIDVPPRRAGGMGIMSLLNDEPPKETRKKPVLQEWFSDADDGRQTSATSRPPRPLLNTIDRLSAISSEGESTDSEGYIYDRYGQPPSHSTAVRSQHAQQGSRLHEPRPYLPDARQASHSSSSLTQSNSAPPPSVSRLATPASSENGNGETPPLRHAYASDYGASRYSRSPIYPSGSGVRDQLSPLAPPALSASSSGTSRPPMSTFDRSSSSMPAPSSSQSGSSLRYSSWSSHSAAAAPPPPPPTMLRYDDTTSNPQNFQHQRPPSPPPREYTTERRSYFSGSDSRATPRESELVAQHRVAAEYPGYSSSTNYYQQQPSRHHHGDYLEPPVSSFSGDGRGSKPYRRPVSPYLSRPTSAGGASAAPSLPPPPPTSSSTSSSSRSPLLPPQHGPSGKDLHFPSASAAGPPPPPIKLPPMQSRQQQQPPPEFSRHVQTGGSYSRTQSAYDDGR